MIDEHKDGKGPMPEIPKEGVFDKDGVHFLQPLKSRGQDILQNNLQKHMKIRPTFHGVFSEKEKWTQLHQYFKQYLKKYESDTLLI